MRNPEYDIKQPRTNAAAGGGWDFSVTPSGGASGTPATPGAGSMTPQPGGQTYYPVNPLGPYSGPRGVAPTAATGGTQTPTASATPSFPGLQAWQDKRTAFRNFLTMSPRERLAKLLTRG